MNGSPAFATHDGVWDCAFWGIRRHNTEIAKQTASFGTKRKEDGDRIFIGLVVFGGRHYSWEIAFCGRLLKQPLGRTGGRGKGGGKRYLSEAVGSVSVR